MAIQFTPLAFGVMLVVAVGTLAYSLWNTNSNRQSHQHQHTYGGGGRPKSTFDCGYDTLDYNKDTDEGQRKRKKNGSEICSICLDVMKKDLKTLTCKHVFHNHCITMWLNQNSQNTCPVCRNSRNAL